jgi:KUP system potassium uptake protein
MTVRHTSSEAEGQLYVPEVNWGLAIACITLVLVFKESSRLAAAYGIAVSGTMGITSIVYYVVARKTWHWPIYKALPLLVLFLSFDVPFFVANLFKFVDGGYVPIAIGAVVFVVMVNWKIGRSVLREALEAASEPIEEFLATLDRRIATRVKGTAIFLTSMPTGVPQICLHHVRRIKVLHETVVFLTLTVTHEPYVSDEQRLEVSDLGRGFHRVIARFGFMERPRVPRILAMAKEGGKLPIDLEDATYYVGREIFLATPRGQMGRVGESLFAFLSQNAKSASVHYDIPPELVVEIGLQLDL